MSTTLVEKSVKRGSPSRQTERPILHRTRGRTHGPITRLMSRGDLGEIVKRFVFLDRLEKNGPAVMLPLHPHSGIATVTYIVAGSANYIDPDGSHGILPEGGLEWMMAGKGIWHTGSVEDGHVAGFQVWLALPPELELAPYQSSYIAADRIESEGPARVLLGNLGSAKSSVGYDLQVNYLGVQLRAGESWQYTPPRGHAILWIAVAEGAVVAPDTVEAGEMVVFDKSEKPVSFTAKTDAHFVLGSAMPHEYDLALGYYSVHTSAKNLAIGEAYIEKLAAELRNK